MKLIAGLLFIITVIISACAPLPRGALGLPAGMSNVNTPAALITETTKSYIKSPPMHAAWQIQYSGEMNYNLKVDVFNLDLFDIETAAIMQLRERGIFIMCYFSAGSFEDWRPDVNAFPDGVLGKDYEGWEGEKWLDIREIEILKPIMTARLDLAAQKGCHGVDPDNINEYTNDSGFPISYNDQITYNIMLADLAHERGLSIGLKNDLEQIADLLPYFDWGLNESCFSYDECDLLLPFIQAGKPVFVIEYDLTPQEFCAQANNMNFNAIQKNLKLNEFYSPCR